MLANLGQMSETLMELHYDFFQLHYDFFQLLFLQMYLYQQDHWFGLLDFSEHKAVALKALQTLVLM